VSGEQELLDALYERVGTRAAEHLLRVAAGLQSMVVGEAQILGQVKDALSAAEAAGTVGEELHALFASAVKAGKRARAETELGRADLSVAAVAVRVAAEALGGLKGRNALVVGAGRTSQLCARLLRDAGIGQLTLANRTLEPAAGLAEEVGGQVVALADVATALMEADLIISATAAPHPVLHAETLARGTAGRYRPLVIVDLAVPPDVEPEVELLPAVSLYTLDALRGLAGERLEGAARSATTLAQVQKIVGEGLHEYVRSRTLRLAVPGIAALRRHVNRSEQAELSRALAELDHLADRDRAIVARFGQRLVDKMFHHLVSRIRALAEYDEVPPDVTMQVLARLFADPDSEEADTSTRHTGQ
jgi:glutamyl-tRNA reductase